MNKTIELTDESKATAVCKVCGLTLQGTDNEGEDICVDCLAGLCFPSGNYNIKEGCIRQSLNIPLTDKNNDNDKNTDKT